jgi:ubiquitin-like domain-containing CTD phosphatase 1
MNGLKTDAQIEGAAPCITLIAKWGKTKHILSDLSPLTSIAQVKELLFEQTSILPKRQKLIGLSNLSGKLVDDRTTLAEVKMKKKSGNVVEHSFILMGTPEDQIFVDPHEKDDLPDVVDDFDFDFNAGSSEVSDDGAEAESCCSTHSSDQSKQ